MKTTTSLYIPFCLSLFKAKEDIHKIQILIKTINIMRFYSYLTSGEAKTRKNSRSARNWPKSKVVVQVPDLKINNDRIHFEQNYRSNTRIRNEKQTKLSLTIGRKYKGPFPKNFWISFHN